MRPDLEFVHFVDGDCEIVDGWLERARSESVSRPDVAVVCGRRRERFPEILYNRLCDMEWDTPVGESAACGGDALMRAAPLRQAGGYRASLIAGEEPELCLRLRSAGLKVMRIDAEMSRHDAGMTRFGQWWRRAVRAGHAFAEVSWLHRATAIRLWVRETRSNWFWGLLLPAAALVPAYWTGGLTLLLGLGYAVLAIRVYRSRRMRGDAAARPGGTRCFASLGSSPMPPARSIPLNPYVVTYVNGTTITLLAYAALPWLMLTVHRGLREPRRWRSPVAFGLLVTATGGGVNGAVTAWMLLGPVLLALYEVLFVDVRWRALGAWLWRALLVSVLVSLWWIVPAYVQSSYGIDFLHFTEQPGTIWGTTSITESLRLMSFWLSYVGIGFAGTAISYFDDSRTLLFSPAVVVATLLLPAAALTGFVWTRRWRYGPFFLALALAGTLIMAAGWPPTTPLRHGLNFTYNHFPAVQFLRASYKAAPLLAIALACLTGAAAPHALRALRRVGGGLLLGAGVLAAVALLCLAAWPLVTGRAQDKQVSFSAVPTAWRQAASALDRQLPANSRAIVLPGDLFSFYSWGGTVDPILPALSRRLVAERAEVPYSDLRATDLLWTIDSLVHQQRLLPGQLGPLLSLIGVRAVVTGTDDDLARSDAPAPADAAATLAAQPGFARAARSYGPSRRFAPTGLGPAVTLAQVRRYDLRSARGLVRVEPRADPLVVDGSAGGVAELAAFGALPAQRALLYAADLSPDAMRGALRGGGDVVISDSNRRQAFVAGSLEQNTGPVLTAQQSISADGELLNPFALGSAAETVATYTGIRSVEAPASPERVQFPEHAPFAAIDGSPATAWLADPTLTPDQRWLGVDLERPRDIGSLTLIPYDDAGGSVTQVTVNGRPFAVHPGTNTLAVGLRDVSSVHVALTRVTPPTPGVVAGAGGIRELVIPGVHATEQLRPPVDAADALRGWSGLSGVSLDYLFQRTTGDDPYQRDQAPSQWSAANVRSPGDAEQQLSRVFELPATRRFAASAWVQPSAQAPDWGLDVLAGYRGAVRASSSSRFDGEPRWRASSALDGNPATAWIGDYSPSAPAWLSVSARRPFSVSRLRLVFTATPVRRPTRVRLLWPGGATGPLAVAPDGSVALGQTVRARQVRLEILAAAPAPGATAAQLRAVGITEVAGLPRVALPAHARFNAPCGSALVTVGGQTVALRAIGTTAAFDDGTPLRAIGCSAPVTLTAGTVSLVSAHAPLTIDDLRLSSAAAASASSPAAAPSGAVVNAGNSSYQHVRVSISRPSWLVLGEGYDRGWRAFCNGRSLGSPTPIDGYANGWQVGPGCVNVHFSFAPQALADLGYAISAVAALACLLLLGVGEWRERRRRPTASPARDVPAAMPTSAPTPTAAPAATPTAAPATTPTGLERSILVGVISGAVIGFVFGIDAGVVAIPAVALILWRGVGARPLIIAAGVLLGLVVPVLYLLHTGPQQGANHFAYASDHMAANWAGVAALVALMAALWRTLAPIRARRNRTAPAERPPAGSPAA